MKANILYFLGLISFIFLQTSKSQVFSYDKYLACGVKNPNEPDDCLDHSLSSGFDCCLITDIPNSNNNVCGLVSVSDREKVIPPLYNGPPYFNCKLGGYYMKISMALLIVFFIF